MMVLFEVYTHGTADDESLLSDEIKAETEAVEMSVEQAEKLGFSGLPDAVKAARPRLIAVRPADSSFIRHKLENNPAVHEFRMHDVQGQ